MKTKMKKVEVLKAGVGFIVGIGVGSIMGNAIKMVRPQDVGKFKDLCIGIGALALSSMVSDNVVDYVNEQIDTFIPKKDEEVTEVVEEGGIA